MMPSGWYSTVEAWLAASRPDLTLWLPSHFGVLGGPGDVVDGEHDLELRVAGRLAGLQVRQLRELGDATGDHAAPGEEVVGALAERQRTRPVGTFTGALHRGVHVCLASDGVHSIDIAVGGVQRLERWPGRACRGRWCFDPGSGVFRAHRARVALPCRVRPSRSEQRLHCRAHGGSEPFPGALTSMKPINARSSWTAGWGLVVRVRCCAVGWRCRGPAGSGP
jgi:hypothetical protein